MISAGSACKERLFAKLMNFLKFRKSFKKLFEPTQKGSLTVHLRAKSRPSGSPCARAGGPSFPVLGHPRTAALALRGRMLPRRPNRRKFNDFCRSDCFGIVAGQIWGRKVPTEGRGAAEGDIRSLLRLSLQRGNFSLFRKRWHAHTRIYF